MAGGPVPTDQRYREPHLVHFRFRGFTFRIYIRAHRPGSFPVVSWSVYPFRIAYSHCLCLRSGSTGIIPASFSTHDTLRDSLRKLRYNSVRYRIVWPVRDLHSGRYSIHPALGDIGISEGRTTDSWREHKDDASRTKKLIRNIQGEGVTGGITGKKDAVILIIIALVVRIIAFFAGILPNLPLNIIEGAVQLYYWYATSPFLYGHIPYVSYSVPYPQLFYVPILIPIAITAGSLNYGAYLLAFASLMLVFDIATVILVYLIADRFFGREKAFLCGLLAATAFGAAFSVPDTYDSFPAFLLVLSLWFMVRGRDNAGWVSATLGTLAKWFPGISFPFFLVYHVKSGKDKAILIKSLIFSGIIGAMVLLPFLLLDPKQFIGSFLVHIDRIPQVNSLIYFLDTISGNVFHSQPFSVISLFLIAGAEGALLLWYYRTSKNDRVTLVQVIFLGLLFFILFNKGFSSSYLIWLTPFLALFLCQSPRRVALFYLTQLIIYLETPVLFGIVYAPYNPGYSPGYEMIENNLPSVSFLFYLTKFALFFTIVALMIHDIQSRDDTPNSGE